MFSSKASSWGQYWNSPPHCIHFLTLLAQINLSTVGLNLDFWRSLQPSCTTQEFISPKTCCQGSVGGKVAAIPGIFLKCPTLRWPGKQLSGCVGHTGVGHLLPPFWEAFHGLGPSSDSFGETIFSIRRREPGLLQLFQRFFPWKPFKFVAPLCAMLISIWLWIVDGYFLLNESVVWVKNISGGREIGLFFFWNRCPMSYFFIWGEIFCRLQKLTALSR